MKRAQAEVARWESGEHKITMPSLQLIAETLGVEFVVRFGTEEVL
jgi:hypothetical protein